MSQISLLLAITTALSFLAAGCLDRSGDDQNLKDQNLLAQPTVKADKQAQPLANQATLKTNVPQSLRTQACTTQPEPVGLIYTIQNGITKRRFELWRRDKTVAHIYPDKSIAELWFQLPNGQIRPTRYFDGYDRAIEYNPSDLRDLGKLRHWSALYQLIPDNILNQATTNDKQLTQCLPIQIMSLSKADYNNQFAWLPSINVMLSQKVVTHDHLHQAWLSDIITDPEKVEAVFNQRSHYQTTDFADIGDHEDDPFFIKMINLGFVEHGASGFYNSDGHSFDNGHKH